MPTPYKTTDNMTKHLTQAERESRQQAEGQLRGRRPSLRAPDWLSDEARIVFDATKRRAREYGVLESVDADLLALYANAVVEARLAADPKDAQAWARLVLSYAEKLGLSATGRARLAKKKAEQEPLDDMELLLGDVENYVNGDGRGQ